MLKVRRGFDQAKIDRFHAEGRGQGQLAAYKPWLTTTDVSGQFTRRSRFRGNTAGRVHHVFSDLEADVIYTIDWAENVVDIRERFPMDRDVTLKIAAEAGLKHPADPKSGVATVQFSDALVDRSDGPQVACSIVVAKELERKQVRERFEIQRRYWAGRRTAWRIITEGQVDRVHVSNIEYCRSHVDLTRQTGGEAKVATCRSHLLALLQRAPNATLQTICDTIDAELKQPVGDALFVLRHLLGTKQLLWPAGQTVTTSLSAGALTVSDGRQA